MEAFCRLRSCCCSGRRDSSAYLGLALISVPWLVLRSLTAEWHESAIAFVGYSIVANAEGSMHGWLLLMRLLHITLGVFWAGTLIFNALFLVPAMRDAGPEGAKVGAGLMQRRFLDIMPVVALLTILSGFWLYWRASSGLQPAFVHSGPGITWGMGALAALIAFGIGVGVMRPAMLRAAALAGSVASEPAEQRESLLAAAQALRQRAARAGQLVALLLVIATVTMAVGRYV